MNLTAFYVALACLGLMALTIQVIRQRKRHQVAFGVPSGVAPLERAVAAHRHFLETTPLFMIGLMLIEQQASVHLGLLHGLALLFLAGRALHAYSLLIHEHKNPDQLGWRIRSMMLTFASYFGLILSLLYGSIG
jgi:uncharacterized membrane protein YecN with MAPEG domain